MRQPPPHTHSRSGLPAHASPQDFFNAELDINNLGCMGPEHYFDDSTGHEV